MPDRTKVIRCQFMDANVIIIINENTGRPEEIRCAHYFKKIGFCYNRKRYRLNQNRATFDKPCMYLEG